MVEIDKALTKVGSVHPLDNLSTEQVGDVLTRDEIQAAFDEEKAVRETKIQMIGLHFELGKHLKAIRDNRWYKVLGANSFEEWVESPEIDIEHNTAYRYARLYERYIESGAFTVEEIADKSMSKLDMLVEYVDTERKDWAKRKQKLLGYLDLTRADLVIALNGTSDEKEKPESGKPDVNGKAGMAVDAKYETVPADNPETNERNVAADLDFTKAVPKDGETVPVTPSDKKLGLNGWYELVPCTDAPETGRVIGNVVLNTESVVISGNRLFVNVA